MAASDGGYPLISGPAGETSEVARRLPLVDDGGHAPQTPLPRIPNTKEEKRLANDTSKYLKDDAHELNAIQR